MSSAERVWSYNNMQRVVNEGNLMNTLTRTHPVSLPTRIAVKVCSAHAATLLSLFSAPHSFAADNADAADGRRQRSIEEVVVTAQRREERLQDVPMSITALSGDTLVSAGIGNAQDLAFAVPGLMVSESGGGRQAYAIRGIFNHRGDSALTGIYLDELPVSAMLGGAQNLGGEGADLRTLDLERVEVLKGPQGTLFGEGAAGGVVRFITKDPNLDAFEGKVAGKLYDTKDGGTSQEVESILNLPLAKEVFGVRLAASYGNTDGWIDQPSNGREDINNSEFKHARVKALYAPTAQLRIKGLVELHRNEGDGANFVNQLPYESSSYVPGVHPEAPTPWTDDYDLYNLTASYDFSFAQLLSSTSYVKTDHVRALGQRTIPEPSRFQLFHYADGLEAKIFNQELRLTSTAAGRFHWTAGAAYKDAERLIPTGPLGFDLILGSFVLNGLSRNEIHTTTSESWASFVDVSYELSDQFEVGGGLRYFEDTRRGFNAATPAIAPLSADSDKVTWRAILKYKPSDNVNLYTNIGTGFRSGVQNGTTAVAAGFPEGTGPEEITSYEIGAKMSLLDRRLALNAAAYFTEYDGLLSTINVFCATCPSGLLGVNSNAQFAEIKGVEVDMHWAATEQLTFSLAAERLDSEIVKLVPSATPQPYAVGDPVNMIPEYSVATTAEYRFNWSHDAPGFLLLSFNRQGESQYTDRASSLYLPSQRVVTAPEKSFLNASMGGEWAGWELSLFGRNLLDERAVITPYAGGLWTPQARPRTFGVVVAKSF